MTNGAITIDVPAGWTAPQLAAGAGQVTTTAGTISVAGQTITVSSLSRNAGQTSVITYAGGIATTTTGSANWTTEAEVHRRQHADEHRMAAVGNGQQRR